ncbi:cyclic lactone autoinducer peptide [Paenibacillus campi]|nr:cyclic lactone autoinducer peptide [Paenibacillus sp. SGZ-1014]
MERFYSAVSSVLAALATFFVSTASIGFVYSPDAPKELLKKQKK